MTAPLFGLTSGRKDTKSPANAVEWVMRRVTRDLANANALNRRAELPRFTRTG